MWHKIRRWVVRTLGALLLVLLLVSLAFNALTQPRDLGPRDAGVPGAFEEVEGSLTHYEAAGNGKLPIVLLHGFGSWSFTWRPVLGALAADGRFRAYAPDLRGFGFTERTGDAVYDDDGYARHVEALIDKLKLDNPVLVGNSMGGDVALRVALDRPDRIRGLVLVDAATDQPSRWVTALDRLLLVPPFDRTLLRIQARWRLAPDVSRRYFDTRSVKLDEELANLRKPLDQRGAEDALISMERTRSTPLSEARLRSLRLPTLIIWGLDDRIVLPAEGRRLASLIPGSRLVEYPRTGHYPQEEQRERFAAELRQFCGQLAPG